MVSTLEAHLIALVTSAAAIAAGFGFFGSTTEQVVVSAAGTIIAALFVVANEIKGKTLIAAGQVSKVK